MKNKPLKLKRKNPVLKDLCTPKYRSRIVRSAVVYNRKRLPKVAVSDGEITDGDLGGLRWG